MNELLNAPVNAHRRRDFFVVQQMFTLIKAVTIAAKSRPSATAASPPLTAAPVNRLFIEMNG
jgi:hypothetical protein